MSEEDNNDEQSNEYPADNEMEDINDEQRNHHLPEYMSEEDSNNEQSNEYLADIEMEDSNDEQSNEMEEINDAQTNEYPADNEVEDSNDEQSNEYPADNEVEDSNDEQSNEYPADNEVEDSNDEQSNEYPADNEVEDNKPSSPQTAWKTDSEMKANEIKLILKDVKKVEDNKPSSPQTAWKTDSEMKANEIKLILKDVKKVEDNKPSSPQTAWKTDSEMKANEIKLILKDVKKVETELNSVVNRINDQVQFKSIAAQTTPTPTVQTLPSLMPIEHKTTVPHPKPTKQPINRDEEPKHVTALKLLPNSVSPNQNPGNLVKPISKSVCHYYAELKHPQALKSVCHHYKHKQSPAHRYNEKQRRHLPQQRDSRDVLTALMTIVSDTDKFNVQSGGPKRGIVKSISGMDVNALERWVLDDVEWATSSGAITIEEGGNLVNEMRQLQDMEALLIEHMLQSTDSEQLLDEAEKRSMLRELIGDLVTSINEQIAEKEGPKRSTRSLDSITTAYSKLTDLAGNDDTIEKDLKEFVQLTSSVANKIVKSKRYASWISALGDEAGPGAIVTPASDGFTYHYRNGERITKRVKNKRSTSSKHHKSSTHHHTNTHKHHNNKGQIAEGRKDIKRCDRCEAMVGEEVCGRNGKTYNSLCHAVNCAGLSQTDIAAGPCTPDEVCKGSDCKKGTVCVTLTKGVCLALYSKDPTKRLTCRQYMCVTSGHCSSDIRSHVCGLNGKTYSSLCYIHKAEVQLAYSGACRPHLCRGNVCGRNGVTYSSSCHARAQGVRIDYPGDCFAESQYPKFHGCSSVIESGRCPELTCANSVLPKDVCCPVCGGAVVVRPDTKSLAALVSTWEDVNHLYIVENFLRKLLPKDSSDKCELTAFLTNRGNFSVILEAVDPNDATICSHSSQELVKSINSHDPSVEDSMLRPMALVGSFLEREMTGLLGKVQTKVLDIPNQVQSKIGEGVKYADKKTNQWDDAQSIREESGRGASIVTSSVSYLALFSTVLVLCVV